MSKKHKCSECKSDYEYSDYYKYNDKVYCESCLLKKLKDDNVLAMEISKVYYYNGEFIGDDYAGIDFENIEEVENI